MSKQSNQKYRKEKDKKLMQETKDNNATNSPDNQSNQGIPREGNSK